MFFKTFLSRSGTWVCELDESVDVFAIDRHTSYLKFKQIEPERRWAGPEVRTLELRTSHATFAHDPSCGPWLRLVIDGFQDSDRVNHVQERAVFSTAPTTYSYDPKTACPQSDRPRLQSRRADSPRGRPRWHSRSAAECCLIREP